MANQKPDAPQPDNSADWEAIARFYAGESTPDEAAAVRQWLESHPDDAAALASLSGATGRLVNATPPDLDVEAALARVTERRNSADVIPIDSRRPARRTVTVAPAPSWRRFAMPAAAAVVIAVGGTMYWHSAQNPGYTVSGAPQTFATAIGKRDSVRLADGTRVVLAPESQLTVAAGYGDGKRDVELRGEAYFDVQHDEARPFTVRAGSATIRDLGTTFTVRTGGEPGVRVVVTSGIVSIARTAAQADTIVLRPGDVGTISDTGALRQPNAVAESDTAWTRGQLVFREAPVSTVSAELRRWYGIDLRIDSSFSSRHLTMTVVGESVDRVLQTLALSLGAEVQRQGNTAVIKPIPARLR